MYERSIETLVLKEEKNNPHLGIRKLKDLIASKYNINISKSTIFNILKKNSKSFSLGRKPYFLLYSKKHSIKYPLIFLLLCLDINLGICEKIAEELKIYAKRLNAKLLEKIVRVFVYSSFLKEPFEKSIKKTNFLKLFGIYKLKKRFFYYFKDCIYKYKPAISLEKIIYNIQLVSSVKFYFLNGYTAYSDARFCGLWDDVCKIDYFFQPLKLVEARLKNFIEDKVFMLYYTKSFDYLSVLVAKFLENLSSGIGKIELVDKDGKVILKIESLKFKPSFLIGYYPKILDKGIFFLNKPSRFKKINIFGTDYFYSNVLTEFSLPNSKKKIILNNILITHQKKTFPFWGVLSTVFSDFEIFLRKYLYIWTYMQEGFLEEMKIIDEFYLGSQNKSQTFKIPKFLTFEDEKDFANLGDILNILFSQLIGDFKVLDNKTVFFSKGKNFYQLNIPYLSENFKKNFNKACFYLDGKKRVFIL